MDVKLMNAESDAFKQLVRIGDGRVRCPCGSVIKFRGYFCHKKTAVHIRHITNMAKPILTKIKSNSAWRYYSDYAPSDYLRIDKPTLLTLTHYDYPKYQDALMLWVDKNIANKILFMAGIFNPYTNIPYELKAIEDRRQYINTKTDAKRSGDWDNWCYVHNKCIVNSPKIISHGYCPDCFHHIGGKWAKAAIRMKLEVYFLCKQLGLSHKAAIIEAGRAWTCPSIYARKYDN